MTEYLVEVSVWVRAIDKTQATHLVEMAVCAPTEVVSLEGDATVIGDREED